MEKEISEIIKKNLPQEVGETLRKTLEEGERNRADLKDAVIRIKDLEEQRELLKNLIEEYKKKDERNSELEAREEALKAGENKLQIDTLTFQLASEKEKTAFTKEVALGLVRNIEYRKNIFDSETQAPYQDNNGNYIYPTNMAKNYQESKQAE